MRHQSLCDQSDEQQDCGHAGMHDPREAGTDHEGGDYVLPQIGHDAGGARVVHQRRGCGTDHVEGDEDQRKPDQDATRLPDFPLFALQEQIDAEEQQQGHQEILSCQQDLHHHGRADIRAEKHGKADHRRDAACCHEIRGHDRDRGRALKQHGRNEAGGGREDPVVGGPSEPFAQLHGKSVFDACTHQAHRPDQQGGGTGDVKEKQNDVAIGQATDPLLE